LHIIIWLSGQQKKNIKATLLSFVRGKIHLNYRNVQSTIFLIYFTKTFVIYFYLHTYIKNVNDILTGKNCKNINDEIKRQAKRHIKFKKQKFALRKEKQLI
jgi:hypothetical protein